MKGTTTHWVMLENLLARGSTAPQPATSGSEDGKEEEEEEEELSISEKGRQTGDTKSSQGQNYEDILYRLLDKYFFRLKCSLCKSIDVSLTPTVDANIPV